MSNRIEPGDMLRFQCPDCLTEFEVTLEPKCETEESRRGMTAKHASFCPFCGKQTIEEV